MKFAALGRTKWLYDAINLAKQKGHRCVLIATADAAPEYDVSPQDFADCAQSLGCRFIHDSRLDRQEHLTAIDQCGADIAISVNWPTLIKKQVRDLFPRGILNAHCGDLPRYRGNACPNWAILNGEREVVVTIHEMVDGLDAGPILLQGRLEITDDTYIGDIYRWLDSRIPELYANVLGALQEGMLKPRAQNDDPRASLRCFPRVPEDGLIDWRKPAAEIARLVRASAEPFAGAYTLWRGEKLIVWRAYPDFLHYPYLGVPGHVAELRKESGEVAVLTGGGILVLQEIEDVHARRGRPSDIIKSTRVRFGFDEMDKFEALRKEVAQLRNLLGHL